MLEYCCTVLLLSISLLLSLCRLFLLLFLILFLLSFLLLQSHPKYYPFPCLLSSYPLYTFLSLTPLSISFSINFLSPVYPVQDLAAYVLTIEIQSALDLVILRSPVLLDIVESGEFTPLLFVSPLSLYFVFTILFRCFFFAFLFLSINNNQINYNNESTNRHFPPSFSSLLLSQVPVQQWYQ